MAMYLISAVCKSRICAISELSIHPVGSGGGTYSSSAAAFRPKAMVAAAFDVAFVEYWYDDDGDVFIVMMVMTRVRNSARSSEDHQSDTQIMRLNASVAFPSGPFSDVNKT